MLDVSSGLVLGQRSNQRENCNNRDIFGLEHGNVTKFDRDRSGRSRECHVNVALTISHEMPMDLKDRTEHEAF